MRTGYSTLGAALAAMLTLAPPDAAEASTIPMPAGSRSWILVGSGDCDDDGQGTQDRGHCAGAVSRLDQPGDIGHDIFEDFAVLADVTVNPEHFRGRVQSTGAGLYVFLDVSMIDTYTLHSNTLPAGTVVPLTVTFRATADLIPEAFYTATGHFAYYGAGPSRSGSATTSTPLRSSRRRTCGSTTRSGPAPARASTPAPHRAPRCGRST